MAEIIQIQVDVQGDLATIWHYWNEPKHIEQWHSASPDWHTINAQNDLRVGGSLTSRMEAKDGAERWALILEACIQKWWKISV